MFAPKISKKNHRKEKKKRKIFPANLYNWIAKNFYVKQMWVQFSRGNPLTILCTECAAHNPWYRYTMSNWVSPIIITTTWHSVWTKEKKNGQAKIMESNKEKRRSQIIIFLWCGALSALPAHSVIISLQEMLLLLLSSFVFSLLFSTAFGRWQYTQHIQWRQQQSRNYSWSHEHTKQSSLRIIFLLSLNFL